MPWHRNAHVPDVPQEVFDPIQPGHNYDFSKAKVEDGVGRVVVEQPKHEDAGGEAAGETSNEGKHTAEWNVGSNLPFKRYKIGLVDNNDEPGDVDNCPALSQGWKLIQQCSHNWLPHAWQKDISLGYHMPGIRNPY